MNLRIATAASLLMLLGLSGCASTTPATAEPERDDAPMPFLLFKGGQAEEAIDFYVDTLPHSRIVEIDRYAPGEPGAEGTVEFAVFEVDGLRIACTDGIMEQPFDFTPSLSFFITCDSREELDRLRYNQKLWMSS